VVGVRIPSLTIAYFVYSSQRTGNGGHAGLISLRYRKQNGQTILKTCGGTGGQSAKNGEGGKGNRLNQSQTNDIKD